jgi:hypothetical protein
MLPAGTVVTGAETVVDAGASPRKSDGGPVSSGSDYVAPERLRAFSPSRHRVGIEPGQKGCCTLVRARRTFTPEPVGQRTVSRWLSGSVSWVPSSGQVRRVEVPASEVADLRVGE